MLKRSNQLKTHYKKYYLITNTFYVSSNIKKYFKYQ